MSDDKEKNGKEIMKAVDPLTTLFVETTNEVIRYRKLFYEGKLTTEKFKHLMNSINVQHKTTSQLQVHENMKRAWKEEEIISKSIKFDRIEEPTADMIECPLHESHISRQTCLDIAESHKHEECAKCPEKKVTETLLLGD